MIKLRVVLAGVLGGIVLFLWLTIAHMATPLGYAGIGQLNSEKAVTDTLKANIPDAGFYFFPGMGVPFDAPRAQRQAAMPAYLSKYAAGPVGILVYRPVGGAMMTGGQLTAELLNNILQGLALAMILALLASHTVASGAYVGFAVGICAATATNVSYWNWYGFPPTTPAPPSSPNSSATCSWVWPADGSSNASRAKSPSEIYRRAEISQVAHICPLLAYVGTPRGNPRLQYSARL